MRAWVIFCALTLAVGASADPAPAPAEASALLVIVHADNATAATAAQLEAWFLRKQRRWKDGGAVVPLNQLPDAIGRHLFDRAVLGMSPDEVARYWLDQRIRSGDEAPREIAEAALTIRLVARVPGTIAYVPAGADVHGVRVVARIVDGKVTEP